MSRQAHLPPRCPLQRKPVSRQNHDPIPPFSPKLSPQHHKSYSQSSIWEEQPDWLDGLLKEDPSINSKGNSHRRSCSDSVVVLDFNDEGSEKNLYGPNSPRRTRNSTFLENGFVSILSKSCAGFDSHNDETGNETSVSELESASLYGPNSPRARRSSDFLENMVVSALSESVPPYCLPYMDANFGKSGIPYTVATKGDECGSAAEPNAETKRHAGPRSRVRKLQYIAELEKRVNFLQALESELAVRIEDLIQQRVTLSMENSNLKQRMARLQEEKFTTEDEYYSLMKEAERLKSKLANYLRSKSGSHFQSNHRASSEDAWPMLDMAKLNIN